MPWGIIGHEWAVEQLRISIRFGADAHAYLFSGPPGVGKRLLALRMAQALNCEHGAGDPCMACRACRRIERGNHPDVRVASMESQAAAAKAEEAARQKELKIATIREWQRDISLRPYEGRRRVFILHDAERLSDEAANAMLKTLEEPPPYATLILVADSHDLLPTIVSRCRTLRLRPLPRPQVVAALFSRGADPDTAALLAAWSGGRIGQALRLLQTPDALARRNEQLAALLAVHDQGRSEAMRWAEQRAREYRGGEQESVFAWLELWQSWWRDVLLVAAGNPEGVVNIDRRADLERIARRHSLSQIYAFVTRLGQAAQHLRDNANPNLVLENLALHAPGT
ncbi:MAG: DNA polymerase III subunit delta' [Oscillochloridaceae bacterium]|nr:DNA polymerase III subunit delta' [Chloroflexaceae bacterium]MDW8391745.1 DNA polymerase III subunit delta' [Oscillochloridaceae bacterium]